MTARIVANAERVVGILVDMGARLDKIAAARSALANALTAAIDAFADAIDAAALRGHYDRSEIAGIVEAMTEQAEDAAHDVTHALRLASWDEGQDEGGA